MLILWQVLDHLDFFDTPYPNVLHIAGGEDERRIRYHTSIQQIQITWVTKDFRFATCPRGHYDRELMG